MKENNDNEKENNINNEKTTLLNQKEKNALNNLDKNDEYTKERIERSRNLYDAQDEQQKKLFYEQTHLYYHSKEKKDPLINIYSKPLQEEYINKVNYIFRNLLITIIFSILIFTQNYLIFKNFKSYTENLLSLIFSSFSFFISVLLIIELFRSALLDQIRYKLYKLFSILFSFFLLCLFITQTLNNFVVYYKIEEKKEKCEKKKKGCGSILILNVILIIGCIDFLILLFLIKFQMWMGINAFRVLFGYELEVLEKQILEDKKSKKENDKNDIKNENDINRHPKQD